MVCINLKLLEDALLERGYKVIFRGQAWAQNCREWVYFDCQLALADIRSVFSFESCIKDHRHRGTHDGSEQGFFCTVHLDGIMGHHPLDHSNKIFHAHKTDHA
jgi:hypothetical protein